MGHCFVTMQCLGGICRQAAITRIILPSWIRRDASATLQSSRYTLSYLRGRFVYSPLYQRHVLPHPRVKVSIVGSLRDREVACSASDRQGSNFESCVWRTVSSQSSHHPQEVLLAQFSLYVHKGGLKPDSFHFILSTSRYSLLLVTFHCWCLVAYQLDCVWVGWLEILVSSKYTRYPY